MDKLIRKLFPNKEMREYNKMHRRHRKELIKLAKETGEWDYSWFHRSAIMQIRHMHEYYSAGNNVWQVDESRLEIVEQLQHILDLNEELGNRLDDCCGFELVYEGDKIIGYNSPDDFKERYKENDRRIQELYEEIYSSIGKHIQCWWD